MQRWESVLRENERATGRNSINIYQMNLKQYNLLLSRYMAIKSALSYLCLNPDRKLVEMLAEYGYQIDMTNSVTYSDSLYSAIQKSENILSQIGNARHEISRFPVSDKLDSANMIAALSISLGFPVSEDITLKQYNAYYQMLKK